MQVYSQQEKEMVVNYVTYNGEGVVYRYKDNAFCLSENDQTVKANLPSAGGVCEGASNDDDDVCYSYIIMVTPIKDAEKKLLKNKKFIVIELMELVPFGTASAPSSSKINKYKYTNVMRGGETNQEFNETKIRYEGAPITFYHVFLVLKNKERC